MKRITITCNADYWTNQLGVLDQVKTINPNETVIFDCIEGFSIVHSGLLNFILDWQQKTNHPTSQIKISSVNHEDTLPFENIHPKDSNGCWPMSKRYWTNQTQFVTSGEKLFGLFVGRSSVARNVIMWQCAQSWPEQFLFSRFRNKNHDEWNTPFEPLLDWLPYEQHNLIQAWYDQDPVPSLDGAAFRDQFDHNKSPNTTLLAHYDRFAVELVCETMTLGTTFFPTEKTVRPIVGLKPFVIYGPVGYLKNLRRMGFRTFDTVWDEDYDKVAGPTRWTAMKLLIQHLVEHPKLVLDCCEIVKYNKQLLAEKLGIS